MGWMWTLVSCRSCSTTDCRFGLTLHTHAWPCTAEHPESWGPDFHDPMNATFAAELTARFSILIRTLSKALHAEGLQLSQCVGTYPTRDGGVRVFYDPTVLGEVVDVIRVMNYDMYSAAARGTNSTRPDCFGMGPTSTAPWAEASMRWWQARVPSAKLVMALPAYSNDYSALPLHGGANGTQAGIGPPSASEPMCKGGNGCTNVEALWEYSSQIFMYLYLDSHGLPRIRYGTEVNSTRAHIRTAAKLGLSQIGFWNLNSATTEILGLVVVKTDDETRDCSSALSASVGVASWGLNKHGDDVAPLAWSAGSASSAIVRVHSDFSYDVSVGSDTWLTGGGVAVRCGGDRYVSPLPCRQRSSTLKNETWKGPINGIYSDKYCPINASMRQSIKLYVMF